MVLGIHATGNTCLYGYNWVWEYYTLILFLVLGSCYSYAFLSRVYSKEGRRLYFKLTWDRLVNGTTTMQMRYSMFLVRRISINYWECRKSFRVGFRFREGGFLGGGVGGSRVAYF